MKHPTNEAKENTDKIKNRFFLGLNKDVFSDLNRINDSLANKELISVFITNIDSINSAISIPYSLAVEYSNERLFTMHASRNAILYPELTQEQIVEKAQNDFEASLENQDEANTLFNNLASRLINIPEGDSDPARELINQGVLLTWSALEVFFRDFIEEYINQHPACIQAIIDSEILRKRMDLRKIAFEYLSENNFNISDKLGSLVVGSYDCSDLLIIKEIIKKCIDKPEIDLVLNKLELWILFQVRHLLIHRRGIIDSSFIEKTKSGQCIGDRILIKPSGLYKYITLAIEVVKVTISAAYQVV